MQHMGLAFSCTWLTFGKNTFRFRFRYINIIYLKLLSMQDYGRSDFLIEIPVHNYSNPQHGSPLSTTDDSPWCCDQFDSPPNCTDPCDNIFIFCLREFQRSRTDYNVEMQRCPYGWQMTEYYSDTDNLTFTVGEDFPGGVPNPVVFSGVSWPVS